jgi:hypothetical protein
MDAIGKINEMMKSALEGNDGIIEVTLLGPNVININAEMVENAVREFGARRARVILDKTFERVELAPGISDAKSPEEKWTLHIAHTNTKELNPTLLGQMGRWAIEEAKRQY